jgi:hypothetical protein
LRKDIKFEIHDLGRGAVGNPRGSDEEASSVVYDELQCVSTVLVNFAKIALCTAVAVSLITIAVAALFAVPNGDDFCRASLRPIVASSWNVSASVVAYAVDSWHLWTGRWASMWLEAATLHNLDLVRAYPLALFAVWLAILAALWSIVRQALPRCNALGLTALLLALYWTNVPEPGDGLFWFTGAVENVLPVALAGAVVALLLSDKWWAAVPLSIIVPGLHELFGALLLVVLCLGTVMVARRLPWLLCASLALASEVIVLAAPGNAVRAGGMKSSVGATGFALWQLLRYLPDWSLSGSMVATVMAILACRPEAPWAERFAGWRLAIIPTLTVGFAVAAIAVSTYVIRMPLAARTVAGIWLAFLVGCLLTAIAAAQMLKLKNAKFAALSSIALAGCLLLQGNTRAGVLDLKDRVRPWHGAMVARYSAFASGVTLVHRAPTAPSIFIALDITEDPRAFRNVCVARYFGLPKVVAR